jgi:hypothetical protein
MNGKNVVAQKNKKEFTLSFMHLHKPGFIPGLFFLKIFKVIFSLYRLHLYTGSVQVGKTINKQKNIQ